jgi:hypothetical protein
VYSVSLTDAPASVSPTAVASEDARGRRAAESPEMTRELWVLDVLCMLEPKAALVSNTTVRLLCVAVAVPKDTLK